MAYPRYPLMAQALQDNVLLLTIRNSRRGNTDNFFVAKTMVDKDAVSSFDNVTFFPLYLYPASHNEGLFSAESETRSSAPGGRRPNLAPTFIAEMSAKLALHFVEDGRGDLRETFGPEDVFDYLYAIFHAPTYRTRYAEFLKIDFPRLPLTSNVELFRTLCDLGGRLVALHVMEQVGTALPSYPVAGNNVVEKIEYRLPPDEPEHGRVYINGTQYVDGVPPEVWEFHVGGYQVCQKWLKDRKGRALSYEDISHYRRMVAALSETITLMGQIDAAIEDHGGWPIL